MVPNTAMRHLEGQEHHRKSRVALLHGSHRRRTLESKIEATMAMQQRDHQIVETPTEARQAEPGPSVLALLAVSTGLAVLILGVVWFVFFRT
jgi:Flp pilus assembly protein TadB